MTLLFRSFGNLQATKNIFHFSSSSSYSLFSFTFSVPRYFFSFRFFPRFSFTKLFFCIFFLFSFGSFIQSCQRVPFKKALESSCLHACVTEILSSLIFPWHCLVFYFTLLFFSLLLLDMLSFWLAFDAYLTISPNFSRSLHFLFSNFSFVLWLKHHLLTLQHICTTLDNIFWWSTCLDQGKNKQFGFSNTHSLYRFLYFIFMNTNSSKSICPIFVLYLHFWLLSLTDFLRFFRCYPFSPNKLKGIGPKRSCSYRALQCGKFDDFSHCFLFLFFFLLSDEGLL